MLAGMTSLSFGSTDFNDSNSVVQRGLIETFVFTSDGTEISGKIYLPASYDASNNHPVIFLIDFVDTHFVSVTDEYETVIAEAEKIPGLDALVVTLEEQLNVDAGPQHTQTYYDMYRDMAAYVEANYSGNTTRTFIGRGSEAGIVMATMLMEDPATAIFDNFIGTDSSTAFTNSISSDVVLGNIPAYTSDKKLHFSFTSSNNRATCTNLIAAFTNAQIPWLQFASEEYPQMTYPQAYPTAWAAGLNFVYNNASTGVNTEPTDLPQHFNLDQNYPNPFNPVTTIKYWLEERGHTTVKVFNSLGVEVSTIVNTLQQQGVHRVRFDGSSLPSGVYHYSVNSAGVSKTKRMILMR